MKISGGPTWVCNTSSPIVKNSRFFSSEIKIFPVLLEKKKLHAPQKSRETPPMSGTSGHH